MRRWHWLTLSGIGLVLGLILPGIGAGQAKKDDRAGEINTPPAKAERKTTKVRAGDAAPDFTLPDLQRTKEVKLSSFNDKKAVVLIFGSYT
jgi:hypothetical protein